MTSQYVINSSVLFWFPIFYNQFCVSCTPVDNMNFNDSIISDDNNTQYNNIIKTKDNCNFTCQDGKINSFLSNSYFFNPKRWLLVLKNRQRNELKMFLSSEVFQTVISDVLITINLVFY
jgi:hypothetical protein